jgi:NADH-quinone oxidoreductase subunit M
VINLSGLPILSAIVFGPLLGAVVLAFLPRENRQLLRRVALLISLIVFGLSLLLIIAFKPGVDGFQFEERASWIPAFGINYHLGVDGISLILVVLTTTLTWISILASFSPIQDRVKEYMISFLVLEVGMLGVFLALDLFLFYIFWEVVLVPMYLIIGIWGGPNRIYATIKFVLYTLIGSLLMLVAILATAFSYQASTGTWNGAFDYLTLRGFGFDGTLQTLAFIAFFLAFAIKVPMWPFHTWLPDAHVEAPTAGSVILAGVLLKLGGYGFIRFALPLYPDAAKQLAGFIIVLSLIAIIYGAIVAMVQPDLKKLVAYSSVSHMGFVTLGIFIFQQQGMQGAILQMVNHGVITGALFLCVGVVYERTHDRTIAKMGGLSGRTPVYAMLFGFFMLASLGLPGLSGFVGEFLVFLGTFAYAPIAAFVATIVVIIGAAYLMWMYQRVVFGELSDFLASLGHHLTDISRVELLTLTPLVALTLLFGLFPGLVLDLVNHPVDQILAGLGNGAAVAVGR